MGALAPYVGAVLATMKRDAHIFLSYRLRVVSQAMAMLFSLLLFYYVGQADPGRGDRFRTGAVLRLRGGGHRHHRGAHLRAWAVSRSCAWN